MITSQQKIEKEFKEFVLDIDYPCVGAKASIKSSSYQFGHYSKLGSLKSAKKLALDLKNFIPFKDSSDTNFNTFVAVFDNSVDMDETRFENLLWQQLQELYLLDENPWDLAVSSDPENSQFGFSFSKTAFFIIGLHPNSSRLARRFSRPTLIFNAHSQFEILRSSGKYQKMQQVIRNRDAALQGCINPMAAEFGNGSEARQYSGRAVESDWKCPFSQ